MLKIIQDYKEWVSANNNLKNAKKELQKIHSTQCVDAIYVLTKHDLYATEFMYDLLSENKLTCGNVQKYFGQDAGRCKDCVYFAEIGSKYKEKVKQFNQALLQQKEARNKLIANLFVCKRK